jgi:hypothetical protein
VIVAFLKLSHKARSRRLNAKPFGKKHLSSKTSKQEEVNMQLDTPQAVGMSSERLNRIQPVMQAYIGSGQSNATPWAQRIERNERTGMNWIQRDNRAGSASLHYRHSGGRTPFFGKTSRQQSSPP